MGKKNTERFEQLGTKIDPSVAEVLNEICESMKVDVYHMLQWFVYTVVKAAAPPHDLDPRINKIMTLLESDAGWQEAFNLANPNRLKVAQVVLILEQENHKGFGAVMIDKPFMSEARMTECVDDILERVTEVTMRGIYRRIRCLGADMGCEHLSDVLLTMLDAQTLLELDEQFQSELPGLGNIVNGKQYAYGKRTKMKQHRTPDSLAQDQRIHFDEYDATTTDTPLTADDVEDAIGCKPFGCEA